MKRKKTNAEMGKSSSNGEQKRCVTQQKNPQVKRFKKNLIENRPLPAKRAKMAPKTDEAAASSLVDYSAPGVSGNPSSNLHTPQENITCVVCLDTRYLQETLATPCGHTFHKLCLQTWLQNGSYCPICRIPLNTVPIPRFGDIPPIPLSNLRHQVLRNLASMRERFSPHFNLSLTDFQQQLRRNFESARERLAPSFRLVYSDIRDRVRGNLVELRERIHPYSSFTFEQDTPDGRVKLSMSYFFGWNISYNFSLTQ